MALELLGIHHLTAIASDPQRNLDFYTKILGLRVVKLTVNFDDPGSYHLYYGDGLGTPGTLLTFFPWQGASRGVRGNGEIHSTTLSIPPGSKMWWLKWLTEKDIHFVDGSVITIEDPDGMVINLKEVEAETHSKLWEKSVVPPDAAIRAIEGVSMASFKPDNSHNFLKTVMNFKLSEKDGITSYSLHNDPRRETVNVETAELSSRGFMGAGSVHHIAWRVPNDSEQESWRSYLAEGGYSVTPVQDRTYFHSIYFREPGGVLFEIATDPPGMGIDESYEELGSQLRIPEWLEPMRDEIVVKLPSLKLS